LWNTSGAGLIPIGILRTTNLCFPLFSTDIKSFTRSPAVGENFTYWCKYNQTVSNWTKFICKGEEPSICEPLASTRDPNGNKRFWMNDNKKKKNITVTVREVTVDDSGTYWCGAESTDEHQSNRFFNRLSLTVGEPCYLII
uniref:Ig-like domain-containing protein n=1 Tax=Neolamprologus brichardi TaxID=32507 RepID=A0A3Q4MGB9_NEOBR